jgi:hypothetical protein
MWNLCTKVHGIAHQKTVTLRVMNNYYTVKIIQYELGFVIAKFRLWFFYQVMTPCMVGVINCSEGSRCLCLQGIHKVEAIGSSETLVTTCATTWCQPRS